MGQRASALAKVRYKHVATTAFYIVLARVLFRATTTELDLRLPCAIDTVFEKDIVAFRCKVGVLDGKIGRDIGRIGHLQQRVDSIFTVARRALIDSPEPVSLTDEEWLALDTYVQAALVYAECIRECQALSSETIRSLEARLFEPPPDESVGAGHR